MTDALKGVPPKIAERLAEEMKKPWGREASPQLLEYEPMVAEKVAPKEFTSQLETIKKAKELRFDPTPGFGKWKAFFPKEAVAHPAKMNLHLTDYLIKNYTEPGHVVLDPMGGTGSTSIVAALNGRDAISVELEDKFVKWQEQAAGKVQDAPTLLKGKITVIKGDARNLSNVLADVVVTSPPYSNSGIQDYGTSNMSLLEFERIVRKAFREQRYFDFEGKRWTEEEWRKVNKGELKPRGMGETWSMLLKQSTQDRYNDSNPDNIGNLKHGEVNAIVSSPPYNTRDDGSGFNKTGIPQARGINKERANILVYSDDKNNIGQIRTHGKVDEVVSSPPYANSANGPDRKELLAKIDKDDRPNLKRKSDLRNTAGEYSRDPANIGNLGMEKPMDSVDRVVTSPPYASTLRTRPRSWKRVRPPGAHQNLDPGIQGYSKDPKNIGNLVDVAISSPPYEKSEAFLDTDFMKKAAVDQHARVLKYKSGGHVSQGHDRSPEAEAAYLARAENGRVTHPDSLGKLEKETYLQAMRTVYTQMFQVLKDGGRAVIVIKPFNRNKQVVDLPWQTWLLLHSVGFDFEDVVKLRLKQLSFWRIMQYRKHPDMEQIRHEYVIVVRKPDPGTVSGGKFGVRIEAPGIFSVSGIAQGKGPTSIKPSSRAPSAPRRALRVGHSYYGGHMYFYQDPQTWVDYALNG